MVRRNLCRRPPSHRGTVPQARGRRPLSRKTFLSENRYGTKDSRNRGTGYIGSHTVVELQQAGYEVVIIDNLSNSNDGVARRHRSDNRHPSGIRRRRLHRHRNAPQTVCRPQRHKGIINFAASKAVGESVQKPLLYYRNNLNTLINLLELIA